MYRRRPTLTFFHPTPPGSPSLLQVSINSEEVHTTSNWMTYQQAQSLGSQVSKGEKATTVVSTKQLNVKDKETEEDKKVGMLRTYFVFNEDQIDDLPSRSVEMLSPERRIEAVEAFITATGADIRLGGNKACYVPAYDFVALPQKHQFRSLEQYYATGLHELSHWAGNEKRLNRDLKNRFGTKAYAAEELVAELSATFSCSHLGITGELRHAEYIANWITLLKDDQRAIFTATSLASKAADYLRTFSEPEEDPQPALFELQDDIRPVFERTIAGRYRKPY